jgi:hypothetical protein
MGRFSLFSFASTLSLRCKTLIQSVCVQSWSGRKGGVGYVSRIAIEGDVMNNSDRTIKGLGEASIRVKDLGAMRKFYEHNEMLSLKVR